MKTSWSSWGYSNTETNKFLLLCKTEINFQATDCCNITAYFRSWNRCAAMRNKWMLWLVVGPGGCQDNGNHEWSTALHSTTEHSMKVNAWCRTRSFEAKMWYARSHAWIVAGNCTAGLCIKITKNRSSQSNAKASRTCLERPWGLQEVETPRFQDNNWHRKATVRLPALRTGPLYPPGNTPSTDFCSGLSRRQGHCTAGRFMLMKNSSETIGFEPATFRTVARKSPHECLQNYYRCTCNGHPTGQEQSANT